jgi:hypothetical protein
MATPSAAPAAPSVDPLVASTATIVGSIVLPLFVMGLIAYLLLWQSGPERLARLLRPFGSVKFLGQEIVLNRASEFSDSAEMTFRRFRNETKQRYDGLIRDHDVHKLHRRLIDSVLIPAMGGAPPHIHLRSTIHVRDILFAESYYQLVPYYPPTDDGKRGDGRSWSIRYGIVGRTWRKGETFGVGNLSMSPEDLIVGWGMTKGEAEEAKQQRPSLIALPIRSGTGDVIAVLFADCMRDFAFGDTDGIRDISDRLEDGIRSTGLGPALEALVAELPTRPLIPMLGRDT